MSWVTNFSERIRHGNTPYLADTWEMLECRSRLGRVSWLDRRVVQGADGQRAVHNIQRWYDRELPLSLELIAASNMIHRTDITGQSLLEYAIKNDRLGLLRLFFINRKSLVSTLDGKSVLLNGKHYPINSKVVWDLIDLRIKYLEAEPREKSAVFEDYIKEVDEQDFHPDLPGLFCRGEGISNGHFITAVHLGKVKVLSALMENLAKIRPWLPLQNYSLFFMTIVRDSVLNIRAAPNLKAIQTLLEACQFDESQAEPVNRLVTESIDFLLQARTINVDILEMLVEKGQNLSLQTYILNGLLDAYERKSLVGRTGEVTKERLFITFKRLLPLFEDLGKVYTHCRVNVFGRALSGTVLMRACELGLTDIARAIVDAGAGWDSKDELGHRAIDLLLNRNKFTIPQLQVEIHSQEGYNRAIEVFPKDYVLRVQREKTREDFIAAAKALAIPTIVWGLGLACRWFYSKVQEES